jgi:F-type H+-transporting ATPase subunit delta
MREVVRGYVAAALESAARQGRLGTVVSDLDGFSRALVVSEPLRRTLTDQAVPLAQRRGVVADLLGGKATPESSAIVGFALGAERAGELVPTLAQVRVLAEDAVEREASGVALESEPPAARAGVRDRIRGYADRVMAEVRDSAEIDVIEDDLFGFARLVEGSAVLRIALSDPEIPIAARTRMLTDLLNGKVHAAGLQMIGYVIRAGHLRDLVNAYDWLVELAAAERGRRIADVRTAVDLDATQRAQLAAALTRTAGRPVEVRVRLDADVIGGMLVSIGDTVIDGTVRYRLERLRDTLVPTSSQGASGTPGATAA